MCAGRRRKAGGGVGNGVQRWARRSAEAGVDRHFPGAGDNLGGMERVEVEVLAKESAGGADAPNARNRTFKGANGDTDIWPDLWPVIASEIGIAPGGQDRKSTRLNSSH